MEDLTPFMFYPTGRYHSNRQTLLSPTNLSYRLTNRRPTGETDLMPLLSFRPLLFLLLLFPLTVAAPCRPQPRLSSPQTPNPPFWVFIWISWKTPVDS